MPTKRIDALDAIRGFALFGILFINAYAISHPGGPPAFQSNATGLNKAVLFFLIFFIESKFFTLFSLLFGVGFSIQLSSAKQKGIASTFFLRRMSGLLLFGLVHIVLIWEGDILFIYAITGILLFALRHRTEQQLLRLCRWLVLVPLIFYLLLFSFSLVVRLKGFHLADIDTFDKNLNDVFQLASQNEKKAILSTSYAELIKHRVSGYIGSLFLLLTRIPTILTMFILGYLAGQNNLVVNPQKHTFFLRRIMLQTLPPSFLISLLVTIGYFLLPPVSALLVLFFNQAIAGPLWAIGTVSGLTLWLQNKPMNKLFSFFRDYGRMALTNYLLQSFFCTVLFYGYGLGLARAASPLLTFGVAILLSIFLMAGSSFYFRYFKMGPMELIWRRITYGRAKAASDSATEK